jgi:pimeloyl-ACP methyl ester carboxylesterase
MLARSPATPSSRSKKSTTVRAQIALTMARARVRLAGFVLADGGAASATRLFVSPRRFPRPPRELELLARGERFEIDATFDGPGSEARSARLPAWRWRPESAADGPARTVLLVHGWEGRGAQLGELVTPLVAAGLTVVAFDAPAHGDAPGRRLYLADMASSILSAGRALGPLHAVVAHSFGAVATSLALARGLAADRVAYIAPASLVEGALRRFADLLQLPGETVATMKRDLFELNGFAPEETAPERLARGTATPLLIVHGEADDEVPLAESRRLAAAWRGADLLALPALGHRRILRDPTALAAVTHFLADAGPAATRAPSAPSHAAGATLASASPEHPTRDAHVDTWVEAVHAEDILR